MNRDERWEKVEASVSEYVWSFEDEEVVPEHPVVEFLIEVFYAGTVWYSRTLVSENELKEFPELYGLTLDRMVESVDHYIQYAKEEHGAQSRSD